MTRQATTRHPRWPIGSRSAMLAARGARRRSSPTGSSWRSTPAMDSLGISQAFAGLVVVAIAGNAVENVVGIQLAAAGQSEYAFSVVLNSPLQIALVLAPVLVIASQVFGLATFTLVLQPDAGRGAAARDHPGGGSSPSTASRPGWRARRWSRSTGSSPRRSGGVRPPASER